MTPARIASALASVVVVASFTLVVGCSGKTVGDDINTHPDPTVPDDAGPDPVCNEIAPACDPGDQSVSSEAACAGVGADYCYSRTASCNKALVWCAHKTITQCTALPACDAGDNQVSACPTPPPGPDNGFSCYPRTVCGASILCAHRDACKALPACKPGDTEVVNIDTCSKPGVSCYSVTACNFTIHCYTP